MTDFFHRMACMSRFRRKNALALLYSSITPCKEPELVAEAVILSDLIEDRNLFLLLQSLGLQGGMDLAGRKLRDKSVAQELMEQMVASGRNLTAIRPLAVDHAVLVINTLKLSMDRRGDIRRLGCHQVFTQTRTGY